MASVDPLRARRGSPSWLRKTLHAVGALEAAGFVPVSVDPDDEAPGELEPSKT